ncbi:MAG: hypothetical protein OM95_02090 [Bdellovibrio sp. ArHS]|nr:MAG: hypothetical protein OM95_02090 [Bdellovibrio sp. ArHS]
MTNSKKTCLVIEDQPQMADFLSGVVNQAFPELEVRSHRNVKEFRAALENLLISENVCLELVLVDLGLPDGSGIEIIKEISEKQPQTKSIVISIYDDEAYLFDALAAGASGFILKSEEPAFMIDILKRINSNEPPLSPVVARRLLAYFQKQKIETPPETGLSARERETLTLLSRGMTVAEASQQMGLSSQTVAGYVKIVYQKLHVSNRVEAVREALRRNLI